MIIDIEVADNLGVAVLLFKTPTELLIIVLVLQWAKFLISIQFGIRNTINTKWRRSEPNYCMETPTWTTDSPRAQISESNGD